MNYADRVKQTTTATSTATIALSGTASGFRPFLTSPIVVGAKRIPVVVVATNGEWEAGWYTLTDANTLTRDTLVSSSNNNLPVAFAAGTKEVICTPVAAMMADGLVDPDNVGIDIVLQIWQSNTIGRGTYNGLFDFGNPRVLQFGGDSTQTDYYRKIFSGADPLHFPTPEGVATNKAGPGNHFARAYAASIPANRMVMLVPLAEGGTGMTAGASNPKWLPGTPTGGTRYEFAIAQANLALAAAQAIYPNSRIVGAFGHPGENDALAGASQATYAAALKALIAGFRSRITGASNMWFVIGGMVPEQIAAYPSTHDPIVAASIQVAAETDKVVYVPGPVGYAATGDIIHYKAEGSRIMGGRMALAVQAAKVHVGAVVADTTNPTVASAAVANASPTTLALSMSEALDAGFVPAASAFTVSGHTVSAVAVSGSTINLTVSAFVFGEAARTVSYTQPATNGARDLAGNLLDTFSGVAITNNVAAADTSKPVVSSAVVANAAPSDIVITFSETLAAFTPATSAFAASGGRTVTGIARSGTTVTVSVDTPYANGDVITVSYTKPGTNPIQDAAGNQTDSFTNQSVTNNVAPADLVAPEFTSAQVANAAPTVIVATMNEALAASTPPTSAFSVSGGKTVTGVSVSGSTVSVTVSSAYVNGDTITLTYAQPGANPRLQDAAGNPTVSFGPASVTNNIAAGEPPDTYTFTGDTVGAAPANTSSGANSLFQVANSGPSALAGKFLHVVAPYPTGVARLTFSDIPVSNDRTVVWRRAVTSVGTGARDGMVLRAQAGTVTGYPDARFGYVFQTSGSTNNVRLYKFVASGATALLAAVTLADSLDRWFRASVIGTTCKLEYSANQAGPWTEAFSFEDTTYTSGGVDYVSGFGGTAGANAYIDDVSWS